MESARSAIEFVVFVFSYFALPFVHWYGGRVMRCAAAIRAR
jgi:hypothetical protein